MQLDNILTLLYLFWCVRYLWQWYSLQKTQIWLVRHAFQHGELLISLVSRPYPRGEIMICEPIRISWASVHFCNRVTKPAQKRYGYLRRYKFKVNGSYVIITNLTISLVLEYPNCIENQLQCGQTLPLQRVKGKITYKTCDIVANSWS